MYKQLTSSQRYVIKNGLKENVPLRTGLTFLDLPEVSLNKNKKNV